MAAKHVEQVTMIPISQVVPAADNPRGPIGDVTELAASIKAMGIIEPLIVTASAEGYTIVAGHRRLAAAADAGLKAVPCLVREYAFEDAAVVRLVENLQRVDLLPLEEASAYKQLMAFDLTQKQIADKVGRSQAHVSKRLSLLELPEETKQAVASKGITLSKALDQVKPKIARRPKAIKEPAPGRESTAEQVTERVERTLDLSHATPTISEVPDPLGIAVNALQNIVAVLGSSFSLGAKCDQAGEIALAALEHLGVSQEQTAAPTEQPITQTESANGNAAPAPVSQHACRNCGQREGPWAEMVDIGWLCTDCAVAAPAAAVAREPEVAEPVDQRARR